jgi:hypothetical protein
MIPEVMNLNIVELPSLNFSYYFNILLEMVNYFGVFHSHYFQYPKFAQNMLKLNLRLKLKLNTIL